MRPTLARVGTKVLTAADAMTSPAVAFRPDAFFEEIAEALCERAISGAPVVDESGAVIGVVSERDLAHALGGPLVRLAIRRPNHKKNLPDIRGIPRGARCARDVMTTPALVASVADPLTNLAELMAVHEINRVPIVDGGKLVGVVTRGDVLNAIAGLEHKAIDVTKPSIVLGAGGYPAGRLSLVGATASKWFG